MAIPQLNATTARSTEIPLSPGPVTSIATATIDDDALLVEIGGRLVGDHHSTSESGFTTHSLKSDLGSVGDWDENALAP
jgi:hypothetical protein